MKTGEQKLLFSFADAVKIPFAGRADAAFKATSKHWCNHLLCNTDGTRLFFLHRWHVPGDKTGFYTHPSASRDGKLVTIDSPHNGGRQLHLIDIHGLI